MPPSGPFFAFAFFRHIVIIVDPIGIQACIAYSLRNEKTLRSPGGKESFRGRLCSGGGIVELWLGCLAIGLLQACTHWLNREGSTEPGLGVSTLSSHISVISVLLYPHHLARARVWSTHTHSTEVKVPAYI